MQKLKAESSVSPKPKVVGKTFVDINANVRQVTKTLGKGPTATATASTVYAYDVERYTIQEYIAKISDESAASATAVAELSDLILTKE